MNIHGTVAVIMAVSTLLSCGGKDKEEAAVEGHCATDVSRVVAGTSGSALAFLVDPMVSSGKATLSPTSVSLDDFRRIVGLEHLGGRGVLEGTYVDVRNGIQCNDGFGAHDGTNTFHYIHSDPRFQEVMAYHSGDQFRSKLDQAGSLLPTSPVVVIAHCDLMDNAYYTRGTDASGQAIDIVCLGDSEHTANASYADDGTVIAHELQHATTSHFYSIAQEFNRFWNDEGGALNEAISDFMSLAWTTPYLPLGFDPKIFSRWALGSFMAQPYHRGAHRCPMYDPSWPACGNYQNGASGFDADTNTASFSYPDGLGWPFTRNYSGPGFLRAAWMNHYSQEQIHNTATIASGALWEIYEVLKANHGDEPQAQRLVMKLVTQAIQALPKPVTGLDESPITFRGFASELVARAPAAGLSAQDQSSLATVLTERGLLGGVQLASGWAAVGPGTTSTPGVEVFDDPYWLKSWLSGTWGSTDLVPQTSGNDRLNPGDVALLWFDIRNLSAKTAGGVLLDVTSLDPDVSFLGNYYNFGSYSSNHAQIRYQKVNGTEIVAALDSSNVNYDVPTDNTYFKTNPYYSSSYYTGLWIKAAAAASHGKTVTLRVIVTPTNGTPETLDYPVTIH